MTDRDADSGARAPQGRMSEVALALRPGMILSVAVAGVVGLVGIAQWDQQLMITGLLAVPVIIALNAVIVAARFWHRRNTDPGALYVDAEEVVRLRGPNGRR